MSKVEVICATLNQNDMSLYDKMNIQTDTVFANTIINSKTYTYDETVINGNRIRMFSSSIKGLAKNRNLGLILAEGEICLFADDDITYVENYEEMIINAFANNKKADGLIFNIKDKKYDPKNKIIRKNKKATRRDVSGYGVFRLACKLSVLERHNISFSNIFGAGAKYAGGGEDTIFLQRLINDGVKIYLCKEIIAVMNETESTWFKGYDEKFFTDKGAMLAHIYPALSGLIAVYHAFRHRKRYKNEGLNIRQIVKLIKKGIKEYKS